jgi:hypothetical protein
VDAAQAQALLRQKHLLLACRKMYLLEWREHSLSPVNSRSLKSVKAAAPEEVLLLLKQRIPRSNSRGQHSVCFFPRSVRAIAVCPNRRRLPGD